jgi:hypothetical protein
MHRRFDQQRLTLKPDWLSPAVESNAESLAELGCRMK